MTTIKGKKYKEQNYIAKDFNYYLNKKLELDLNRSLEKKKRIKKTIKFKDKSDNKNDDTICNTKNIDKKMNKT